MRNGYRGLRWAAWGLAGLLTAWAAAELKADHPRCLRDLDGLAPCALENLYRNASPGPIPCGYQNGRVFAAGCKALDPCREKIANLLWRGKWIDCCTLTSINQWPGAKAIRSNVAMGSSWLDGQPSIILDYRRSSFLWRDVRDEMRQLAPGLYLGIMYLDRCPQPQRKFFFAIETPCP